MILIKRTLTTLMALTILLLLLCAGQMGQWIIVQNQLQDSIIKAWEIENPDSRRLVKEYRHTCLGETSKALTKESLEESLSNKGVLNFEVTLSKCAEAVGVSELHESLVTSSKLIEAYAWPLSWLDDLLRTEN